MNKIKLVYILCLFSGIVFSQNPDTTRTNPSSADTSKKQATVVPADDNSQPPTRNYPPDRRKPPRQRYDAAKAEDFWKKVYWGGNLALALGSGSGYYEISPNAGYKF